MDIEFKLTPEQNKTLWNVTLRLFELKEIHPDLSVYQILQESFKFVGDTNTKPWVKLTDSQIADCLLKYRNKSLR